MRAERHYAKARARLSWDRRGPALAAWLILQGSFCASTGTGMKELRYDILFNGELLPGCDSATVAANLARLFKASHATVSHLMDGASHVIKRDCDRETATRYRGAMEQAGARAILREIASAPAPAAAIETTPAPASNPDTSLTIAPAGSDVLAAHERRTVVAAEVNTAHISLVSAFGAAPQVPATAPPPAPDTTHISIAEAGADLLPHRAGVPPPPPPDTSAITLAAAGAPMAPPAEPVTVDLPDISALTLAPPGADLEPLRAEHPLLEPDTSALGIEPLK